MQALTQNFNVV